MGRWWRKMEGETEIDERAARPGTARDLKFCFPEFTFVLACAICFAFLPFLSRYDGGVAQRNAEQAPPHRGRPRTRPPTADYSPAHINTRTSCLLSTVIQRHGLRSSNTEFYFDDHHSF